MIQVIEDSEIRATFIHYQFNKLFSPLVKTAFFKLYLVFDIIMNQ